ncbi:uncharacterized protein LOC143054939 [Mytilus galloprovincialis]|uniref:uncharacterized protein LOC143054939 n=1 Tax=Mytilus galloprovincialis TaxID=29158 RepID=UPI003F7B3D92
MALTVKAKKIMAKYRKDEVDQNDYVNTAFTTKDVSRNVHCDENDQPYYDQLDHKDLEVNNQKAKPNEYSQWEDRQISADEIYENNEQSVNRVLQQKAINHLEPKLPIQHSSKEPSIRHCKIGIVVLAVICVILVVALISVAVVLSARSPCEGRGCLNNGICKVVDGDFYCECQAGFVGLRCEVTPCDTKICENGGECYLNDFQSKCSCRLGFDGENCTVTPCSSNPCLHTGECTLGLNTSDYLCSCPAGFTGANCQETPCSSDPCNNNGVCTYTTNSNLYNCTCPRGFSGRNCQVTPCSSTPCQNNGICNVVGYTYNCVCLEGFANKNCTDYICNAEYNNDFNCILEQDRISDNVDWIRRSGSTPTSFTGPSQAAEGNYYFYYEGHSSGSTARLISRTMKTGYTKCLSFNYHMYGSTMGLLYVYGDNRYIWGRSGNRNNIWYFQTLTISSSVSKITFHAQKGSNIYSDIAIDNITITPSAC